MKPVWGSLLAVATVAVVAAPLLVPSTGRANPAFARQTQQPCAACHVGGFGPQLTDFGRAFKLNGYADGPAVANPLEHIAGMAYGGFEHTRRGFSQSADARQSGPITRFRDNDNWTLDQTSLFYGGRLYDHLGAMAQVTYSDPTRNFSWDNTDVRYANQASIGDNTLIYGVTANNNPTVQDVWQSTPAWGFPYLQSRLAPAPATQPLVQGALAQQVVGLGAYGQWNDRFYAELDGYTGLSHGPLLGLGVSGGTRSTGCMASIPTGAWRCSTTPIARRSSSAATGWLPKSGQATSVISAPTT